MFSTKKHSFANATVGRTIWLATGYSLYGGSKSTPRAACITMFFRYSRYLTHVFLGGSYDMEAITGCRQCVLPVLSCQGHAPRVVNSALSSWYCHSGLYTAHMLTSLLNKTCSYVSYHPKFLYIDGFVVPRHCIAADSANTEGPVFLHAFIACSGVLDWLGTSTII